VLAMQGCTIDSMMWADDGRPGKFREENTTMLGGKSNSEIELQRMIEENEQMERQVSNFRPSMSCTPSFTNSQCKCTSWHRTSTSASSYTRISRVPARTLVLVRCQRVQVHELAPSRVSTAQNGTAQHSTAQQHPSGLACLSLLPSRFLQHDLLHNESWTWTHARGFGPKPRVTQLFPRPGSI